MNHIALTGLLKIELPSRTLLFSDAGFFSLDGEIYRDEDEVFGTIGSLRSMEQAVGNVIQAIIMSLKIPNTSSAEQISVPTNQMSPVTVMTAEYDPATGVIIDTDVEYTGQIDQTILTVGEDKKELSVSIVSQMERAFQRNNGNYQSSAHHKSIWPNETGHDQATGLVIEDAWGTESRSAAGSGGASGSSGGIGGGGRTFRSPRNVREF